MTRHCHSGSKGPPYQTHGGACVTPHGRTMTGSNRKRRHNGIWGHWSRFLKKHIFHHRLERLFVAIISLCFLLMIFICSNDLFNPLEEDVINLTHVVDMKIVERGMAGAKKNNFSYPAGLKFRHIPLNHDRQTDAEIAGNPVNTSSLAESLRKHPAPSDGCPPKVHFGRNLPMVALFSFPGSGNTWVRHLLQVATGIYTGSVYRDHALLARGFRGEGRVDPSVCVIKLHEIGASLLKLFTKAIILLRDPADAIVAEYNRRKVGHVRRLSPNKLDDVANEQFAALVEGWRDTNALWITNFTGPVHFVHYHDLRWNMTGAVARMLDFLNWEVTAEQLRCVTSNSEGRFHRAPPEQVVPNMEYFNATNARTLRMYKKEVYRLVRKRSKTKYYWLNEMNIYVKQ